MKINMTLAIVMGILGALAGLSHDLGKFRDACNVARAAGQTLPPYDFPSTLSDMITGGTAAFASAIGLSQIPGAGGQ